MLYYGGLRAAVVATREDDWVCHIQWSREHIGTKEEHRQCAGSSRSHCELANFEFLEQVLFTRRFECES